MTRTLVRYRCSGCAHESPKWLGRCPECGEWGSLDAATVAGAAGGSRRSDPSTQPVPLAEVDPRGAPRRPTRVPELDRVLGGGLVPGSVVLLAGEPGVGKSTLLISAAAKIADSGTRCLIVTGEESAAQVRLRAGRIGALSPQLFLAAETELSALLGHVDAVAPAVLIVDSVQTIGSAAIDGSAGGVAQVREVASTLIKIAKTRGISTLLVGHVTKDGAIAGPRTLEHLVDVVLSFEGDRHSRLRLVRTVKNRFGPADEVGCFDLQDDGIVGLPDPSGLFLAHGSTPVAGTCVTVTMEGRRALVTEVQALVNPSTAAMPRRACSGLDAQRVAMMLAVIERRVGRTLNNREVYTATVGGVRLAEPASDLALALAVIGAADNRPIADGMIAIGEVGLAGELRPVSAMHARLSEAARLGFTIAIVPRNCGVQLPQIRTIEAATLDEAVMHALPKRHER
jgi:DNA repair protein RadA/Sms